MPDPLASLRAPIIAPDPADGAYQAARRILEEHPGTAGLGPMETSSLAQQLVEEMESHWLDRDDGLASAYEGFRSLLERKGTRARYVDEAIPPWARERYAREQEEFTPGSPLPMGRVA